MEKALAPTIQVVPELSTTIRNEQAFGSTETRTPVLPPQKSSTSPPLCHPQLHLISPSNSDDESSEPPQHNPSISTMTTDIELPYHIILSSDPIDNTYSIPINLNGTHPTLGLVLESDTTMNRIKIINCLPSSPAAKIPKWRSTIRHGYLTKINNTDITSIAQATKLIQ